MTGSTGIEVDAAAAARARDGAAFGEIVDRYRPELWLHCYRMLASVDDAETVSTAAVERAHKKRRTYQSGTLWRPWLYWFAADECLEFLTRHPRPKIPHTVVPAADPWMTPLPPVALPWLQPCSDQRLDAVTASEVSGQPVPTGTETTELAYVVALQHVTPWQRWVVVLRDVVGLTARQTGWVLGVRKPPVSSAVQRARPTVHLHLPQRRHPAQPPTSDGTTDAVVDSLVRALELADGDGLAELLYPRVRYGRQPAAGGHAGTAPVWQVGRDTVLATWSSVLGHEAGSDVRVVRTTANRQPALAVYTRQAGQRRYRALSLDVLRLADGLVAEVAAFPPAVFASFGLSAEIEPRDRR